MDNNSSEALPTDQAILVAFCPVMRQAIFTTNGGARSELTGDLNLLTFTGQAVQTYIGFISADGRNASVSNFTGQVTVS